MVKAWVAAFALVVVAGSAAAQDAKTVVSNASRAMGVEGLNSIHYYGVGQNGNLGQNNNANQPWPMTPLNDYVRAIDFTQPASRATARTWAVSVVTNQVAEGTFNQVITPATQGWAQQLEIWITPWGFLKGAMANNATARSQTVDGRRYQVVTWMAPVTSPGGQPYRVVGFINNQNLVERVQTWLDNPLFGDMLVETDYTFYRDNYGLKYPAKIVQKRAGWPTFEAQIVGAHANPANLQQLMTPPAPAGRGAGAPAGGAPAAGGGRAGGAPTAGGGRAGGAPAQAAPAPAASEKLAEGVFRIRGAYNALAVEFSDHVLLFEPGPQSLVRGQEIIAETKKVIPNKPIRYGVISHHHLDHTGGLAEVVAEGITIVTPEVNRAYLQNALSTPRTLAPDNLAKSKRKPQIEGFTGDLRVFQDSMRTFEVHVIKGLPHADGLVVGYLLKEKILVYADMFNLPPAETPVPDPPVTGTRVFLENIERLKLDVDRIMSVHSLNPDRLTSVADIRASLGRK
jgi:glyoxylase-like metal-dependent hydrolase (beta-lactamase superfamily II)